MPCYVDGYDLSNLEWVEWMLCQACRKLNREQIKSIKHDITSMGMFEWYCQHLLKDFMENYENEKERFFYEQEGKRIGVKFSICDDKYGREGSYENV